MKFSLSTVAVLAIASFATLGLASESRRQGGSDFYLPTEGIRWTSPMAIDARPVARGAFASVSEYFSSYKGRKLEMSEIVVGAAVDERISFWVSRQSYLVKGRSSTSRFRVNANSYGAKWVVRPPNEFDRSSIALEFETVKPETAVAVTNSASATFGATRNNRFAVDYGFGNGLQTQLGFSSIKGAGTGDARIFTLGVGKDLSLKPNLDLRLQGEIAGQWYTDTVETVNGQFKPVLYAALGYQTSKAIRIELDGSLFPSGMPLESGRFTGLSSFQIYRPGGVAEGLRTDAIGFGSLRLVLSGKF
ncbi:hypothetical protein [Fimbriimonas ginsengisoli]|nr:hypothetical protein [Fimbriimonas ginsengisoli]